MPPTMWTYLVVVCVYHSTSLHVGGIRLEDKLSPSLIQGLAQLCPKVDICEPNATGPEVRPNGILDVQANLVSACHGCSCHKDCHLMMNCCFFETTQVQVNATESMLQVMNNFTDQKTNVNGSTKLPVDDENDFDDRENSAGLNGNPPDDVNEAADDEGLFEELTQSRKQCLYTRTGSPDDEWVHYVPAYQIVSKKPIDGCIATTQPGTDQSRMDRDVKAPWGDLFPVYSNHDKSIYKNESYARCHGAKDTIHWTPILVCDNFDKEADRIIPVSEHFEFLRQDSLTSNCFVTFEYHDTTVLDANRCFVDTIATCPITPNADSSPVSAWIDLLPPQIVKGCSSGLNAPIRSPRTTNVFRNIFCLICNEISRIDSNNLRMTATSASEQRGSFGASSTYLLDTSFLKENLGQQTDKQKEPYKKVKDTCRELFCPSGQIRNNKGVCKFPSREWFRGSFLIVIKMKPIDTNISLHEMKDVNSVVESLRSTSPWLSQWKIYLVLRSSLETEPDGLMVVYLVADIVRADVAIYNLRKALAKPWTVAIDGTFVTFEQSILEYILNAWNGFPPRWTAYVNETEKIRVMNISDASSISWSMLYGQQMANKDPVGVTKTFTCDLVSLYPNEYALLAKTYVLENKLTGQFLFDREFELVENGDDELLARVCLTDTPFVLNTETNGAPPSSGAMLPIAISIAFILYM